MVVARRGLAAGTIDNNIGKLKTIFQDCCRGSAWNSDLNLGNPACHPSAQEYYSMVLEEQTLARSFPSQAVPFFLDKLEVLCNGIRSQLKQPNLKPSKVYVLARDLAFFSVDFFSGDRGSDLGRIKSSDVSCLPENKGFIFNQVFGKTLRGNGSNVFAIPPLQHCSYCPVTNLKCYLSLSKSMSINLKSGFLFRTLNSQGFVSDAPFSGSAVENRLKTQLEAFSISEGETMHSFRSGCSITLTMLGVSYEEIAMHVGWKSLQMVKHYCQLDEVLNTSSPSAILAKGSTPSSNEKTSEAQSAGKKFRELNSTNLARPLFEKP